MMAENKPVADKAITGPELKQLRTLLPFSLAMCAGAAIGSLDMNLSYQEYGEGTNLGRLGYRLNSRMRMYHRLAPRVG
jgi:hypothetical protein